MKTTSLSRHFSVAPRLCCSQLTILALHSGLAFRSYSGSSDSFLSSVIHSSVARNFTVMQFIRFSTLHVMLRLTPLRSLLMATCVTCVLLVSFNRELSYLRKMRRNPIGSNGQLEQYLASDPNLCSPKQHVLFLKTHKTGSTTIANIFFRYGDSRKLSFVLGKDTLIGWPRRFQISLDLQSDGRQSNFLCSHTRYNQKPMNYLFPKTTTKYVTILRNPVDQFESVFNYMGLGNIYGLGQDPIKSLEVFFSKGIEFKDVFKTKTARLVRNPNLFDLGLAYKFHQNVTAIKKYIAFLEKEFDLIMITDYFDESVVLLKRLLCWELEDILYFKSNERQDNERAVDLSEDVKENIKRWNAADLLLFDYFNQTFWRKIEREGKDFYDDLAAFRKKRKQISRLCLTNKTSIQLQYANKYVKAVSLKQNLNAKTREYCERMTRSENSYLAYLRRKRETIILPDLSAVVVNEKDGEITSWDVSSELKFTPVSQKGKAEHHTRKKKKQANREGKQAHNQGRVKVRGGRKRNKNRPRKLNK